MRYSVGNSIFGMSDYPARGGEWSIVRKIEELHNRGYDHLEGDFGGLDRSLVRRLAADAGLELGYIRFGVRSDADMEGLLREAGEAGGSYVVAIVGHAFDSVDKTVDTVGRYREMARKAGLPFLLETHRDSATQDLLRLNEVLRQLPDLDLMVDLSHMLVAGEITDDLYEPYAERLQPILERACGYHGRISNGNQIQIGLLGGNDPAAERFGSLWAKGLAAWKKRTEAEEKFFRFTVELGPPPYALTIRRSDGTEAELHDRLEQGELLRRLFSDVWERVIGQDDRNVGAGEKQT
ncbi:sugar phosphate isomerase/epimerase family protein [Paenibacillus montanisoli]|uniref:Sugar phosphate isomerase/epimerase n=1 Tax=Paenibacillus montanisoli TaxID=2081970 RepID=A0A328U5Q5_9BACL|nr:hypothetical protein [Paenibacillus montanisoli]RAP77153.1 hypothetical protein DL346_01220 [Paenibacillus montanisoli]